MKHFSENSWLRFLVVIYSLAFCLLLVTAFVTAYVLSHPELGLQETNPIVRDYVSQYGLELGLLLVNLYNFGVVIFAWILFASYLILRRKYRWKITFADSIIYGAMLAYGLYLLISWLLNAANDVSWLLFRSNPYIISAVWESWDSFWRFLALAIFFGLFSIVHYSTRRKQREARATDFGILKRYGEKKIET